MHTIWTNELDYEDWKEDLEEQYPDSEGYTENDRIDLMYDINNDYLDDEKTNLNKELGNDVICFADLGLWNGRRAAYKPVGTNLNSIFNGTCGDYVTWYVEGKEVKCKDIHHDGTNRYVYRLLKEYIDFDDIALDEDMEFIMERYTEPLGHYVAEIYGFELEEDNAAV